MDLVDEEHVALAERGEDRGHVALPFERGAGGAAQADAELLADDVGEARLAETGRPDQEEVVEGLAARSRRLERDCKLFLDPLLGDELVEAARPERALELVLLRANVGRQELSFCHAASFSACRTCSSTGRCGSTRARACSACTTV